MIHRIPTIKKIILNNNRVNSNNIFTQKRPLPYIEKSIIRPFRRDLIKNPKFKVKLSEFFS